jgi:DNA polymerase-3 subunit delta'
MGSAIDADSLHHALLFEGPPGVGKRTVARHLAMAHNCLDDDPQARPCTRCRSCTTIASGNHPDVVWVEPDAKQASGTIPIARIREVVRQAGYHRFGARRRFIIIDPAEAMGGPAANALLKTLEEPPDGTGFILLATNAKALLPTIISRCQRVRFGPVPTDALITWLTEQGVENAPDIASVAFGCPGVAMDMTAGALATRRETRDALINVLHGDLDTLFKYTQKLCSGGRAAWRPKAERVFELLEELIRDAAVSRSGSTSAIVNMDRPEVVARWAEALWPDGVAQCHAALTDVRLDLKRMVSGRTALDALLCTIREQLGVPEALAP